MKWKPQCVEFDADSEDEDVAPMPRTTGPLSSEKASTTEERQAASYPTLRDLLSMPWADSIPLALFSSALDDAADANPDAAPTEKAPGNVVEAKQQRCGGGAVGGCGDRLWEREPVYCRGCGAPFARYHPCYYSHVEQSPDDSPCKHAGRDPPIGDERSVGPHATGKLSPSCERGISGELTRARGGGGCHFDAQAWRKSPGGLCKRVFIARPEIRRSLGRPRELLRARK